MTISVLQMNGCTKCANECITLMADNMIAESTGEKINWFDKESKIPTAFSTVIITGYARKSDTDFLKNIRNIAARIILFGTCATHGGIFGLQNQKSGDVIPISQAIKIDDSITGCLASGDELNEVIKASNADSLSKLCDTCPREPTCDFLSEVHRQFNSVDAEEEQCLNDTGVICSGYVANTCKEKCINFDAPCRGCRPLVENSGSRMMGFFGTLMGQMEVATEASTHGATDKLADQEDDISQSVPDVVGNFFRFTLPASFLSKGKKTSQFDEYRDIFEGRLIEELPSLMAMMGGNRFISNTISILKAYEQGLNIQITPGIQKIRSDLLELEKEYQSAVQKRDFSKYISVTEQIRDLAGNMNLSNLYYGGMRIITDFLQNQHDHEILAKPVPFKAGTYSSDSIEFKLDEKGVVYEWKGGNK